MANDGFPVGAVSSRLRFDVWTPQVAYIVFLLLVFVGLSPFAVRDAAALATGQDVNAGAGDLARQICYLLVLAVICAVALQRRGLQAFALMPLPLAMLLLWCLLSTLWAAEPGVAFRRAGLAVVVVLSTMLSVDTLGAGRSLRIWRIVLACVLILNWLSILFLNQAVHLPGEADTQLVGDWRGLYYHKNIAGAVSAISAIVFVFFAFETRRWIDIALAAAAIGFTVMTHSKASLGLLPIAIVLGALYRFAAKRPFDRQILMIAAALVVTIVATVLMLEWNSVVGLLTNPQELSGRIAIWQAEIGYIGDHPLLGAGFGSFADTGARSPLYDYMGSTWVGNVSHGHNGYLQLLVTTGAIGFALAMLGLIVQPLIAFWRGGSSVEIGALLFAIFCFVVLHNVVESDFLEGDGPAWVAFLLTIAMLRKLRNETAIAPSRGTRAARW